MPLAGLIYMLARRSIHFTRLDQFEDPFEGTWPDKDHAFWKSRAGFDVPAFTDDLKKKKVAACCWIECQHKSAAMWDRYAYGRQGIGIKTNYGTLKNTITPSGAEDHLWLFGAGRVEYIDHLEKGLIERLKPDEAAPNSFIPFMLKNISYDHEREVRILVISKMEFDVPQDGLNVPVDPNRLIQEIVVNPHAQPWFKSVVEDILAKYELSAKLVQSKLRPLK